MDINQRYKSIRFNKRKRQFQATNEIWNQTSKLLKNDPHINAIVEERNERLKRFISPVKEIIDMKEEVRKRIGMYPNVLIMQPRAWRMFRIAYLLSPYRPLSKLP